ncbi:TetR/AcrR family transcriptional regulator [Janibacter sp. GXQ6167]|uniref:TetR/AcrR family transcriptional regulator n=1 Tax=Janibacter sp. GXQ6167 TaxID=3240791 RepID=UPI003526A174
MPVPSPSRRPAPRERLSREDRRRQLIGLGLAALTRKPAHAIALDEIAAEAGISRGLLFHYFPSKRAYFSALVEAAGERLLHNTEPDPDAEPRTQIAQMVTGFIAQVERRRDAYLGFIRGFGGVDAESADVHAAIWQTLTDRVLAARPDLDRDITTAWWAYVEARALSWSAASSRPDLDDLVGHCTRALDALHQQ